jgi:hypothetical protein
MSYIAVVFRHPHELFRQYAELIPGITVRLLQDCPAEASSTRKVGSAVFDWNFEQPTNNTAQDFLIAMQHILQDEYSPTFLPQIGCLARRKSPHGKWRGKSQRIKVIFVVGFLGILTQIVVERSHTQPWQISSTIVGNRFLLSSFHASFTLIHATSA